MANVLAIVNEIFDICWLLALLTFLILIWRSSEKRRQMETALIEIARQDSLSAKQAVESVRTLAAIVQNEQAK